MLGVNAGEVIHRIRAAVTGRTVGPGLFETLAVLGRERVLGRLEGAAAVEPTARRSRRWSARLPLVVEGSEDPRCELWRAAVVHESQDGVQVVGAVARQCLREPWVEARRSQPAGAPAHDEVSVMACDRVSLDRPHELLVTSVRGFLPEASM